MKLEAEQIMTLYVQCGDCLEVKDNGTGYLRIFPIVGGTVEGKVAGEVVCGGADWNTTFPSGVVHVCARYLLTTTDGYIIDIHNEGYIKVDTNSKIKSSLKFKADINGKYAWLNHGVYVASLDPGQKEGQVIITVYKLD